MIKKQAILRSEPSIQYRAPFKGTLAFDDGGKPVPVVQPEVYEEDPPVASLNFNIEIFLDTLIDGTTCAEEAGQRLECLAFLLKLPSAARTLRELGDRLGCSHVTAAARLTKLYQCLSGLRGGCLSNPPINEEYGYNSKFDPAAGRAGPA